MIGLLAQPGRLPTPFRDCQLRRHHVQRRDHGLRVAAAGIGGPDGPSNSPAMGQAHPAERSHLVPGLRSDNPGGSALGTPMQKHGSVRGSIAASASKDELTCHKSNQSPGVESKRKHGGHNKGKPMSAATKAKMRAAKKRHWKDPEYRAKVTTAIRASILEKDPWNKGRQMSRQTRIKMSIAHNLGQHTLKTRKKMSRSHMGRTHTEETRQLLSAQRQGKRMSASHKLAIAAGQRRRHAACRVLAAVEEVHNMAAESRKEQRIDALKFQTAGDQSSSGLRGAPSSRPKTKNQLLEGYHNQLREYRALQEELTPWTNAFEAKHQRKPTLGDVQATNITWLIVKYKSYVMLRQRLLANTPALRDKFAKAAGYANTFISAMSEDRSRMLQPSGSPQASAQPSTPAQLPRKPPDLRRAARIATAASNAAKARAKMAGKAWDGPGELPSPYTKSPHRMQTAFSAALTYRQNRADSDAAAAASAGAAASAVSSQAVDAPLSADETPPDLACAPVAPPAAAIAVPASAGPVASGMAQQPLPAVTKVQSARVRAAVKAAKAYEKDQASKGTPATPAAAPQSVDEGVLGETSVNATSAPAVTTGADGLKPSDVPVPADQALPVQTAIAVASASNVPAAAAATTSSSAPRSGEQGQAEHPSNTAASNSLKATPGFRLSDQETPQLPEYTAAEISAMKAKASVIRIQPKATQSQKSRVNSAMAAAQAYKQKRAEQTSSSMDVPQPIAQQQTEHISITLPSSPASMQPTPRFSVSDQDAPGMPGGSTAGTTTATAHASAIQMQPEMSGSQKWPVKAPTAAPQQEASLPPSNIPQTAAEGRTEKISKAESDTASSNATPGFRLSDQETPQLPKYTAAEIAAMKAQAAIIQVQPKATPSQKSRVRSAMAAAKAYKQQEVAKPSPVAQGRTEQIEFAAESDSVSTQVTPNFSPLDQEAPAMAAFTAAKVTAATAQTTAMPVQPDTTESQKARGPSAVSAPQPNEQEAAILASSVPKSAAQGRAEQNSRTAESKPASSKATPGFRLSDQDVQMTEYTAAEIAAMKARASVIQIQPKATVSEKSRVRSAMAAAKAYKQQEVRPSLDTSQPVAQGRAEQTSSTAESIPTSSRATSGSLSDQDAPGMTASTPATNAQAAAGQVPPDPSQPQASQVKAAVPAVQQEGAQPESGILQSASKARAALPSETAQSDKASSKATPGFRLSDQETPQLPKYTAAEISAMKAKAAAIQIQPKTFQSQKSRVNSAMAAAQAYKQQAAERQAAIASEAQVQSDSSLKQPEQASTASLRVPIPAEAQLDRQDQVATDLLSLPQSTSPIPGVLTTSNPQLTDPVQSPPDAALSQREPSPVVAALAYRQKEASETAAAAAAAAQAAVKMSPAPARPAKAARRKQAKRKPSEQST